MGDIFISYAKADRAVVQMLARALDATGWSVFWDHEVPPGTTWRDYIGQELLRARCVIVVWSKGSVDSHWVLEEAEVGRGRRILIPVRIDDVMPPLGFQSLQAASLSEWDGTPEAPDFKILVAAIEALLRPASVAEQEPPAADVEIAQKKKYDTEPRPEAEEERESGKLPRLSNWPLPNSKVLAISCVAVLAILVASALMYFLETVQTNRKLEQIAEQKKEQERAEADSAREETARARTNADSEKAVQYAKDKYESALALEKAAVASYNSDSYVEAKQKYSSAGSSYGSAAEWARQVKKKIPEGMEYIPAGEFTMGCCGGRCREEECPQHRVYVDAFYMDKHEVTVGQYKEFRRATTGKTNLDFRSKYSPSNNHPVTAVNWDDAMAYARWAGKRLPTEAEWEYACRAGTTTDYNTGNNITHDDANYWGTGGKDIWMESSAPVGSFSPNPWGLFDMHGNVTEWCYDWYEWDYYRNSPTNNPQGPTAAQERRVVRGGSFLDPEHSLRSAERIARTPPRDHMPNNGFRCVRDAK